MDALVFVVMSGADRALRAQQVHANNLANLETAGFRADLELARSAEVARGYGYDARHLSRLEANAVAARQGTLRQTGRELDVAIAGEGYFAVEWRDGEAYTRAGAFELDAQGVLMLHGRPVLGEGGRIELPPHSQVAIAEDGTVSVRVAGQAEPQAVDRLKRVRPAPDEVVKNEAGLIVARSGEPFAPDDTVLVRQGHLEGSNVSAIEEMVATMDLNREFEIQMKLFRAAESMAQTGDRLIRG